MATSNQKKDTPPQIASNPSVLRLPVNLIPAHLNPYNMSRRPMRGTTTNLPERQVSAIILLQKTRNTMLPGEGRKWDAASLWLAKD